MQKSPQIDTNSILGEGRTMPRSRVSRGLLPLALCILSIGFLSAPVSAQVVIRDVSIVDVSPTGFSAIWQGTPEAVPSIAVFADESGAVDITEGLSVVVGPIITGDLEASSPPEVVEGRDAIRDASASVGVQRVRVDGLSAGTTYHVRLGAELGGGGAEVWPEEGLHAVTTSSASVFVVDAKQVVVNVSDKAGADPLGWIVYATHADTTYGVSAVVGDGAAGDEAVLNLANFVSASGEGWVPAGEQDFVIAILRGGPFGPVEEEITLDFSMDLQVISQEAVSVTDRTDTDGDGIADDWEEENFGTLARDGSGDFDDDGLSDREEFGGGTDPRVSNVPIIPQIYMPDYGEEVTTLRPQLLAYRRTADDPRSFSYEFEVFADGSHGAPIASEIIDAEPQDVLVGWSLPGDLDDNAWFDWRVRSTDGYSFSEWVYGRFFVNLANDAPGAFVQSYPTAGAQLDTRNPTFEVSNSVDIDGDRLEYRVEIFSSAGDELVATIDGVEEGRSGRTSIEVEGALDEGQYSWRAVVTDEHGAETATELAPFSIDTGNAAPAVPEIAEPALGSELAVTTVNLVVNNAADPEGETVTYRFEIDTVPTFDSPALRSSGALDQGAGDTTTWTVADLSDETRYFWRAQSDDSVVQSPWVYGHFTIDTSNESPPVPTIENPGGEAWIGSRSPTLTVFEVEDPDGDMVIYRFALFSDFFLSKPVASTETGSPGWDLPLTLDEDTWYFWIVQAEDEHGEVSEWTSVAAFFVNTRVEQPPRSDVGSDGTALVGAPVALDASDSRDPQGRLLSYVWSFVDVPAASGLSDGDLTATDDPQPLFTPDEDGVYRLRLEVSNGTLSDISRVAITASASTPPNADAGRHRDVLTGDLVALDGTGSEDPDDGPEVLTFRWSFDAVPPSSVLRSEDIVDRGSSAATFTPDVDGVFLLRLTVDDGATTDSSNLVIRAASTDVPPNAHAGGDLAIELGESAVLDASASDDADSSPQPLAFSWRFVSLPEASALTNGSIVDADTSSASFTPDVLGTFVLSLQASDGLYRAFDNVAVSVGEPSIIEFKFLRGDSNNDGRADLSDSVYILNFLFTGGSPISCDEAADINNDGPIAGAPRVDLSDAVYLLNHLFTGGPPPDAPYPGCDLDPEGGTCPEKTACGI